MLAKLVPYVAYEGECFKPVFLTWRWLSYISACSYSLPSTYIMCPHPHMWGCPVFSLHTSCVHIPHTWGCLNFPPHTHHVSISPTCEDALTSRHTHHVFTSPTHEVATHRFRTHFNDLIFTWLLMNTSTLNCQIRRNFRLLRNMT